MHYHMYTADGRNGAYAFNQGSVSSLSGDDGNDDLASVGYATAYGHGSHGYLRGSNVSVTGGAGDDSLRADLNSFADAGSNTQISGTSRLLDGGAGYDYVNAHISLYTGYDPTIGSSGMIDFANNTVDARTGADGGVASASIQVIQDGYGTTYVTANAIGLLGGDGADTLVSQVWATTGNSLSGIPGGIIDMARNTTVLDGGLGDDSLILTVEMAGEMGGGAIYIGNTLRASGGEGADNLHLSFTGRGDTGAWAIRDNIVSLDGGAGNDMIDANFGPGAENNNLVVTAGSGDDIIQSRDDGGNQRLFVGGGGNDTITDHAGFSTAAFEGRRSDYSIVDQGGGYITVTDLRTGSPDGGDTLYQVDQLRFADGDFLVANLLSATAPAAPTLDLAAESDTGTSNTDDITSDSTPTLHGTAAAGSTVDVYEGTTHRGQAIADASGNWSLTLGTTALADGAHVLTATATDAMGNVSPASLQLSITVDTVTANPTIVQASHVSDTLVNLEGTAEAGSQVAIRDGNGNLVAQVTALADGTWSYELETPLMDGDYVYCATATDLAGNVSSTVSTTVSILVEGQVINGGNGDDTLTGTDGRDTINGGNGIDTVYGGWAADQLFGGSGDDSIYGGAGGDLLQGENGADRLVGDAGADTLDGGRGDDTLTGGAGYDYFVVDRTSGNDTVTDFTVGEDSLFLNEDVAVSSIQESGSNTLVNLSNGAVMTLENVILTSVEQLFAPPPETTTCSTSSSGDLLLA